MSNVNLLSSLQTFLNQRAVDVERLTAEKMVALMVDWFRLAPIDGVAHASAADTMLFRYGGWSEGCVTGFKFGLLRRIATGDASDTEWLAGITLMRRSDHQRMLHAQSLGFACGLRYFSTTEDNTG